MKLRRRLLVSFAGGTGSLLCVWLLFKLTDHDYGDIWQGSPLHVVAAFAWMWPYFAIQPFKVFVDYPSIGLCVIFALDIAAYTAVVFLASFALSKRKRKAYSE